MRRTTTLLTVIFAFAVATAGRAGFAQSGQSETRSTDAQRIRKFRDANVFYERAKICFGKRDIAGTRKELGESLELSPEFADAHLLMAKVLYTEKAYEQALAEVVRAKADYLRNVALWERIQQDRVTEMHKRREEKEEALADLRGQLSRLPLSEQNSVQSQISKLESDKEDIDRILNTPPPTTSQIPAEYYFFHGNVLLRLQKNAEAAGQYGEALKIKPAYGEAANNLASLYYSTRQYEQAMAVVKKAETDGAAVNPELKKAIEGALRQPK